MAQAAKKKEAPKQEVEQQETKNELALIKQDVVDVVSNRVEELVGKGQLELPEKYAVGNALMAWWLALQVCVDKDKRPALQVCTRDSVANATLDMVVQGLSPAKKQCYPVVYGRQLVCQRSYFGDEAVLRRARPDVAHVKAEVYYEGDDLDWSIDGGFRTVGRHVQAEENIGGLETIRGGYVVITDADRNVIHCERMTIDQVKKSWEKSKTFGKGDTFHTDQPEEAVKRTVLRRACKRLINASDDSYLVRAVQRQDTLVAEAEVEAEMLEDANGEVLAIDGEVEEAEGPGEVPEEAQEAEDGLTDEEKAEIEAEEQAALTGPGF